MAWAMSFTMVTHCSAEHLQTRHSFQTQLSNTAFKHNSDHTRSHKLEHLFATCMDQPLLHPWIIILCYIHGSTFAIHPWINLCYTSMDHPLLHPWINLCYTRGSLHPWINLCYIHYQTVSLERSHLKQVFICRQHGESLTPPPPHKSC